MNPIGHLSRRPLIRELWIDSHPVPRRPGKLNHLRRRVPSQQVLLQLHRIGLPRERPNLHTPSSARIRSQVGVRPNRRRKRLHSHLRNSRAINPRSLRRSQRQIDNPSPNKRPPIRDLHHSRLIGAQVGHPHHRSHRQRQVCRCHRILVVHCAVRPFASCIGRPVPARQSNLRRDRIAIAIRSRNRGGNHSRRPRTWLGRSWSASARNRTCRSRRRRRLIRSRRLSMAARSHQRKRRKRHRAPKPRTHHDLVESFGGGGGVFVRRACSSIRCASLCSSAAAARRASDPFFRTSGTTSSLMYFTTWRRSASRCVAASRNCCSHGRFCSSVGIRTPLHSRLDDVKNSRSTPIAGDSTPVPVW